MKSVEIHLSDISDVKKVVQAANTAAYSINLVSDKYIIDAKSIIGIFSLDFSKPIEVQMFVENDKDAEDFLSRIQEFIK